MTIDEAINYHEDMAEVNECAAKMLSDDAFLHMDSEYKNECRDNAIKSAVACKEHRQLAKWLTELKEAKRLLKAAVEDINAAEACDMCEYYPVINGAECQKDDCYKWRYADEALKLIGGETE